MKITVSARVAVYRQNSRELLTGEALCALDGIKYEEDGCANYLDNELAEVGLTEGFLRLAPDPKTDHMRVFTAYVSPRKLKAGELKKLAAFTEGQWSDGMGESCFDDAARQHKVVIDLMPSGIDRDVRMEQAEDGKPDDERAKATRKLLTAVTKGDMKKAQEALDAGADIEAKRQGFSVLDHAVGDSQVEIVKLLLQRGANPNCGNIIGGCPLSTCALNRTVTDEKGAEMAAILIAHGADVNLGTHGCRPLDFAINREKVLLQQTLRAHGALAASAKKK